MTYASKSGCRGGLSLAAGSSADSAVMLSCAAHSDLSYSFDEVSSSAEYRIRSIPVANVRAWRGRALVRAC